MSIQPFFAYTDADGWRAGIGDPSFMGWFTVAAYVIAAILCGKVGLGQRLGQARFFWFSLAALLAFLAVNKQLDLQTWFTLTGKKIAQAQGWYENRRIVQAAFIVLIAVAGVLGFRKMWKLIEARAKENWLALAGLFFVLTFVVVRAASFHHVDIFLKSDIAGFRMNWLLELVGIGMIIAGAVRALGIGGKKEARPFASRENSGRLRSA